MNVTLIVIMLCVGIVLGDWDISRHLSTKTPYHTDYVPGSDPSPPGCSIHHLQIVARYTSTAYLAHRQGTALDIPTMVWPTSSLLCKMM